MPFPAIAQPIVNLVISRVLPLLLPAVAQDIAAARALAIALLEALGPETDDEFHLAAEITSLRLTVLAALAEAAEPDVPLRDRIRARSGAVSLSREAQRVREALAALQDVRLANTLPAEPEPVLTAETTAELEKIARTVLEETGKKRDGVTWTQAYHQRLRANRIAASAKKNQARYLAAQPNGAGAAATAPPG